MPFPSASVLLLSANFAAAVSNASFEAEIANASPRPDVVQRCQPLGALLGSLAPLGSAMNASFGAGGLGEPGRFWLGLLEPAGARAAGLDLEGPLTLRLWGKAESAELVLPFSGSSAQARHMLDQLPKSVVEPSGEGWHVRDTTNPRNDMEVMLGTLQGQGVLIFRTTAPPPSGEARPSPAILQGWPTGGACDLYVGSSVAAGTPLSGASLALHLPLEAPRNTLLRVEGVPVPGALARAAAPRSVPSSETRPLAVVVLGVPTLDLVSDPLVARLLRLDEEKLEALEKAKGRLTLEPGSAVAVFSDRGGTPGVVLALLVTDAKGRPLSVARHRRLVRKVGRSLPDFERTARNEYRFVYGGKPWSLGLGKGRLAVGTDAQRVREAANGQGTPWVSQEDLAWAGAPALAFWFDGELPVPKLGDVSLRSRGALATRGGVWELRYENLEPREAGESPLLRMLMTTANKNFQKMRLHALVVEIQANTEGIYTTEVVHRVEKGAFVATSFAPRVEGELDAAAAPWRSSAAWDELGWKPGEDPRGIYRVEVSADGERMAVHAVADLDGDGTPSRWVRDEQGLRRLSPEGVW